MPIWISSFVLWTTEKALDQAQTNPTQPPTPTQRKTAHNKKEKKKSSIVKSLPWHSLNRHSWVLRNQTPLLQISRLVPKTILTLYINHLGNRVLFLIFILKKKTEPTKRKLLQQLPWPPHTARQNKANKDLPEMRVIPRMPLRLYLPLNAQNLQSVLGSSDFSINPRWEF